MSSPASVDTGGVAPLILSTDAISFAATSATAAVANKVYVYEFELNESVTVTAARWRNGSTAAGHTNMAIYDASGNLVSGSDTGAQSNAVSTETTFTYATSFRLGRGVYYLALACDTTDTYFSTGVASTTIPITRARVAANALAAGAMPSTLGALSGAAIQPCMAFLVSGGLS
jgi:hypothetical protein